MRCRAASCNTCRVWTIGCSLQCDVAHKAAAVERTHSGGINCIDEMTQQIASAAEEQSATSREINQNIHVINDVARQTVQSVTQSAEAGDSLAQLAEQLRGIVLQFRI